MIYQELIQQSVCAGITYIEANTKSFVELALLVQTVPKLLISALRLIHAAMGPIVFPVS